MLSLEHCTGDVNNDGFNDIIAGKKQWATGTGQAKIVYGSFFALNCKTTDAITGKCLECDSGYGLSNDIPGTCDDCNLIPGTWSNGTIPCSCQFSSSSHTASTSPITNFHHTHSHSMPAGQLQDVQLDRCVHQLRCGVPADWCGHAVCWVRCWHTVEHTTRKGLCQLHAGQRVSCM
jgi:hypothetical protein